MEGLLHISCCLVLTSYLVFILLLSSLHPHFTENILSRITNALVVTSNTQHVDLIWCDVSAPSDPAWLPLLHSLVSFYFDNSFSVSFTGPSLYLFHSVDVFPGFWPLVFFSLTPWNFLCDPFHSPCFHSHLHKTQSRSVSFVQNFWPKHNLSLTHFHHDSQIIQT